VNGGLQPQIPQYQTLPAASRDRQKAVEINPSVWTTLLNCMNNPGIVLDLSMNHPGLLLAAVTNNVPYFGTSTDNKFTGDDLAVLISLNNYRLLDRLCFSCCKWCRAT
jgi:hypothetical protein